MATFGYSSVGTTPKTYNDRLRYWGPFTASSGGTIQNVVVYLVGGAASQAFRAGIWSGTASGPQTLVALSGEQIIAANAPAAWVTFPISGVITAGTFWLGLWHGSTGDADYVYTDAAGTEMFQGATYASTGAPPDVALDATTYDRVASIYCTYTTTGGGSGSSGSNVLSNIPNPWAGNNYGYKTLSTTSLGSDKITLCGPYLFEDGGTIDFATAFVKGNSSSQKTRMVIYRDDGSKSKAGSLLWTSNEVTIPSGSSAQWRTWDGPNTSFSSGYYWIGIWADAVSSSASLYYRNAGHGRGTFSASYISSGSAPSTPSGTSYTAKNFELCMAVMYTPNPVNVPTSLAASNISADSLTLSWASGSSKTHFFRISRSSDGGSTWSPLAFLPADTTSYRDVGLKASTTYQYRIGAVYENIENTSGSLSVSTTSGTTSNPTVFTPSRLASTTIINNALQGWLSSGNGSSVKGGIDYHTSYYRFEWKELEKSDGVYDFTAIDNAIKDAVADNRRYGFRVRCVVRGDGKQCPSDFTDGEYCDNKMGGNDFIPHWNSSEFKRRMQNLMQKLGQRYNNDQRVAFVDVGIYGTWGEWHLWPYDNPPSADYDTKKFFVDLHGQNFPDKLVTMMLGPSEITGYVLQNYGRFGARADSMGNGDFEFERTFQYKQPEEYRPTLRKKYRTSPIIAETDNPFSQGDEFEIARNEVYWHHVSMVSDVNVNSGWSNYSSTSQDTLIEMGREDGYRYILNTLTLPEKIAPGRAFTATWTWENENVAPTYEPWVVKLELRDSAGAVKASWSSSTDLTKVWPTYGRPIAFQDTFTPSTSLAEGTYYVHVSIPGFNQYVRAMKLANGGLQSNNTYRLGQIVVEKVNSIPVTTAILSTLSDRANSTGGVVPSMTAALSTPGASIGVLLVLNPQIDQPFQGEISRNVTAAIDSPTKQLIGTVCAALGTSPTSDLTLLPTQHLYVPIVTRSGALEIYIARQDGFVRGVIDRYASLDINRVVNEPGSLTLTIPPIYPWDWFSRDAILAVFEIGAYGVTRTLTDTVWFITNRKRSQDRSGLMTWTIEAKSASTLLDRRLIAYRDTDDVKNADYAKTHKVNYANIIAKEIVRENMGTRVADLKRTMNPYMVVAPNTTTGIALELDLAWKKVGDVIKDVANASYEKGWPLYYDVVLMSPENLLQLEFRTYDLVRGRDLRHGVASLPVLIGPDHQSFAEYTVEENGDDERTFVYVGGDGEDAMRAIVGVENTDETSKRPLGRIEDFLDAREVADTALTAEGQAFLRANAARKVLSGKLVDTFDAPWRWGDWISFSDGQEIFDCRVNSWRLSAASNGVISIEADVRSDT